MRLPEEIALLNIRLTHIFIKVLKLENRKCSAAAFRIIYMHMYRRNRTAFLSPGGSKEGLLNNSAETETKEMGKGERHKKKLRAENQGDPYKPSLKVPLKVFFGISPS